MQDRNRQIDEILLRRTAGPYIGSQADHAHAPTRVRFGRIADIGLNALRSFFNLIARHTGPAAAIAQRACAGGRIEVVGGNHVAAT